MDRDQARAELLRIAATVRGRDDAPGRLLARVADADAPELSAALVELGAAAAIREAET